MSPILDAERVKRLLHDVQQDVEQLEKGVCTNAEILQVRERVVSSARDIITAVEGPKQVVKNIAREYTFPVALKICLDLGLPDFLRATKQPVSTLELAKDMGADGAIIDIALNLLSSRGVFRKQGTSGWCDSELSETFSDKSFVALINSTLDESFRSCAALPAFLEKNGYQLPSSVSCPFMETFGTPSGFYSYCSIDDQPRGTRFSSAMIEVAKSHLEFFVKAYPFERIAYSSPVIDVAGGLGQAAIFLAGRHPQHNFVVEELGPVLEAARQACPLDLKGRISFWEHDMLQPRLDYPKSGEAPVFLLKSILHDWDDQKCRDILTNVISAMGKGGRLLIIDTVKPNAQVSLSTAVSDLMTISMFGGHHRTLHQFVGLIQRVGVGLTVKPWYANAGEYDNMLVIEVYYGHEGDCRAY